MRASSPSTTSRSGGELGGKRGRIGPKRGVAVGITKVTCCASRSSARANITLSGKKKRKLLKQLQHSRKEEMEGRWRSAEHPEK